MEERVLDFWEKSDIFQKTISKDAPKGNFVFFEGPPTANGVPGIHHILARAFKDVIPRFKTMNGFKVLRKAGWDTHGLPVELQVEKELNISGKGDIEKYGIAEFNKKCKESVWKFKDEWERLTKRIAFWLDLKNPYVTYENSYIESLWYIIGEVNKKGLLYKGHKVVPHCPSCGTALSSHEVAQGYKSVKENSVYINFKVTKGNEFVGSDDIVLAWTTTPWTLPGNVALAIGENITYTKIKYNNKNYILAKDRLEHVFKNKEFAIAKEFKGKELLDIEYEPLFKIQRTLSSGKKAYYITSADFVTTSDGTGVVHTAVMYGEDDYNLGDKIDLPKIHVVDEAGKFTDDLKEYNLSGKFVKNSETEKIIIDHLKNNELLFDEEIYEHDYPFCWRCESPLLYYAKDSWFIEMSAIKDELIKNSKEINWIPEYIKTGRFGEWLENVKDWAISRERYWGTPIPIWECEKCNNIKVVGSVKELSEFTGEKITIEDDIHKPEIDKYEIICSCGEKMKRVKEVFDCWFDSGAMPFAQYHYPFENKELIDNNKQYPADYICEAIDQTRGWFYTLLAISTLLGKGTSYKNVICLGHINDKFGKKMSKSKNNIINPNDVIEQFGVDAVRLHMYTINQPGEGKNYDIDDVRDVFRKNIMLLWNVYKFYEMYTSESIKADDKSKNILDKWILIKLNNLCNTITKELENYHIYEAAREIPIFIDELSTWYLRRSRDRFKGDDANDKRMALNTLKFTFGELSKLIAPFMPFVSETLYQKISDNNFDSDKSVHLEKWPEFTELNDEQKTILEKMNLTKKIVELGLAERDKAGIKIRQMLNKITINFKSSLEDEYLGLIKDELNIKRIELLNDSSEIQVVLDTEITEELKNEGIKRELIRYINLTRKEMNLNINDRAIINYKTDSVELKNIIDNMKQEILKETLSDDIVLKDNLDGKVIKINDIDIILELNKK